MANAEDDYAYEVSPLRPGAKDQASNLRMAHPIEDDTYEVSFLPPGTTVNSGFVDHVMSQMEGMKQQVAEEKKTAEVLKRQVGEDRRAAEARDKATTKKWKITVSLLIALIFIILLAFATFAVTNHTIVLGIDSWVLIQKHVHTDTMSFNVNWEVYKNPFGDRYGSAFWYGLDPLHHLTKSGQWGLKMQVNYDKNLNGSSDPLAGTWGVVEWSNFSIASEADNYRLKIGPRTVAINIRGNNDNLLKYNNGMGFSNLDKDNDKSAKTNCASTYTYV